MRIEWIAFTQRGFLLAHRAAEALGEDSRVSAGFGEKKTPLTTWTAESFAAASALIFVGAAGIAVRAVAPHLHSKLTDPAVLVLDEGGRFCISLLSGHAGGGNALCARVAAAVGAQPVVTTATDGRGLFSVDSWAKSQRLAIVHSERIKAVSGKLLDGRDIAVCSAFAVGGALPAHVRLAMENPDVVIDVAEPGGDALLLVPRAAVLGIGCRSGTAQAVIEEGFARFLSSNRLRPEAIGAVASIDLKAKEKGLIDFCAAHGWPFATFSAAQLWEQTGDFIPSDFVRGVTGVDNVCERSAVAAGGALAIHKQVHAGVTFALALRQPSIRWECI